MIRRILIRIFTTTLVLGLIACSAPELADLQSFVDAEKMRKTSPIDPIPEIRLHQRFSYQATNLRDPFEATVIAVPFKTEEVVDNGIKPNEHRRKEALEAYALKTLKFVGVLERGTRSAMIKDSEGVIHLVRVGSYMGKNNGRITSISDTEIRLKEVIPGKQFAFEERENVLVL